LIAASWDKKVRLYDAKANTLRATFEQKAAVMDAAFSADDTKIFSGGLDKSVVMYDVKTGKQTILGSHDGAIRCVEYSATQQLVATGGWDSVVSLWDARQQGQNAALTASATQPSCKVYTMALAGPHRLLVATSGRHVFVYDLRNIATPEHQRESALMNQTRCVRAFVDGSGFALSSTEGRVAIEYLDLSAAVQKKKYAFKCHRKTVGKTQQLYPVNTMAFHPVHGTFATGGCDGLINVWDWQNKKRICQYPAYATSISSLAFNRTGSLLAVAASYTWEEGDKDHPSDAIFIRSVNEFEVRPKTKSVSTATAAAGVAAAAVAPRPPVPLA